MADETTQTDTANSTENETVATEATTQTDEQSQSTDTEATETSDATDTSDSDGTVLGGEEKSDDADASEAEGAPEKYELTLEDGDIDPALLEKAEPVLREMNLTNEQANKLAPVAAEIMTTAREQTIQQITDMAAQQKADWLKISKDDEVIGGPQFEQTTALAAKAMDALGFTEGHPFRTALNETGFGNHRDVLFTFRKLGELVGEDGFERGNDAKQDAIPTAKKLYPND